MKKSSSPVLWSVLLILSSFSHVFAAPQIQSQSTLDPGRWYRLTNTFLGEERALEVDSPEKNTPYMGRARESAGQLWHLHPVKGGLYRITNKQLGEGMGLDIGREEGNAPVMAPTGDPRGQLWKVIPVEDGGWCLTNQVLGKGRALDTYSDGVNAPFMGERGEYSGQSWYFKPEGYIRATLITKTGGGAQGANAAAAKSSAVDYIKLTAGQRGAQEGNSTSGQGKAAAVPAARTKGPAEQAYDTQQQIGKATGSAPGKDPALAAQVFDVDAAHFDEQVVKASDQGVVVAFFEASWCGNCQAMGPELAEEVKSLGPGVALAKIDIDNDENNGLFWSVLWALDPNTAEVGLPGVMFYQGGRVVQNFTGYLTKDEIAALLEPLVSGKANSHRGDSEPATANETHTPSDTGELERQVVAEINLARTDPPAYAHKYLVPTRAYYNKKLLEVPGEIAIETTEGVGALDECIKVLLRTQPLPPLSYQDGLALAARDHAQDQGPSGATGHTGGDGSTMQERISRYVAWGGMIGENIDYGNRDARGIVTSLLIDDGVPSRGHRENLLNGAYNLVGVAVGPHKIYGDMCVMDFAGSIR